MGKTAILRIPSMLLFIQAVVFIQKAYCQFGFSNQKAFRLTSEPRYPTAGNDVILQCRRKTGTEPGTVEGFLGREDNVSWEENDLSVLTTEINKNNGCRVIRDNRFLTPATFGSSNDKLSKFSCEYDGTTISLTIKNWTPARPRGDLWKCVQFPFAESKSLEVQSYVPVEGVSIQQDIDRFNQPSRGTIVTCITSPARPDAHVSWYIEGKDGDDVRVTTQADLRENVKSDFNGLSVTTSSILLSKDEDHGIKVYCRTSNQKAMTPILSDKLTVMVKYRPTVEIQVDPGPTVLEGTDITLHCIVFGRPTPSLRWIRTEDDSSSTSIEETEDEITVISLEPTVFFRSITMRDSGNYSCIASNEMGPDITSSVVLFVRELPPKRDADSSSGEENDSKPVQSGTESGSDPGAIAGATIAIIIVLVIVSVVVILYVRKRWGKNHDIVGRHPRGSISNGDGQAIYATCASLPRNSELPPYVDVLPPSYRNSHNLSNITNPGYEMVDNVVDCIHGISSPRINGKRPLPSTPPPIAEYPYEEINDDEAYLNDNSSANNSPNISTTNNITTISTTPRSNQNNMSVYPSNSNSSTLPLRSFRMEYCGYEVPVSPKPSE